MGRLGGADQRTSRTTRARRSRNRAGGHELLSPEVHAQVVAAAAEEDVSVSAWMTSAARRALLVRDGLRAVAEWEAQQGALTDAELGAARGRVADALGGPARATPA